MGYSCNAITRMSFDEMLLTLQAYGNRRDSSNTWTVNNQDYYVELPELSKEHADGHISGTIWRFVSDNQALRVGSIYVEPKGKIRRWPTTQQFQRLAAESCALAEFLRLYGEPAVERNCDIDLGYNR